MAQNAITLSGQTPDEVFDALTAKGVNQFDATKIVGDWIVQNSGPGTRSFSYSNPVSPTESPDCAPHFVRSFVHEDWVDGVSAVQAGLTPSEQGFNDRLHRIENDLDALSADIKKLFSCLGDLRSGVAQALIEVANELNTIDQTLGWWWYDPTRGVGAVATGGGAVTGSMAPKYVGSTTFFGQAVNVWQTEQGVITLPGVQPPEPGGNPLVNNIGNFSKYAQNNATLQNAFTAAGVTVQTLISQFGNDTIDDSGTTVSQALSVLPATAQYTSLSDLTNALAASSAAVIRASGIGDAAVATSFVNLGSGVQTVSSTPIGQLQSLSSGAANALAGAGITTVGALANADPNAVHLALANAGLSSTVGDAASLTAVAKTLSALR